MTYDTGMTAISSIPNLGPASEEAFAKAGITSAEEIRTLGPEESYRRLLQAGARPHFIGYYVLVMGLQGRPWNDCQGEEKKNLRKIFDKIKSERFDNNQSELEAFLDKIGVISSPSEKVAR